MYMCNQLFDNKKAVYRKPCLKATYPTPTVPRIESGNQLEFRNGLSPNPC